MQEKSNVITTSDKSFLDSYWDKYQRILFEQRNDSQILALRDSFKSTTDKGGTLVFVGNGASASLASHAATDFTKQANVKAIAFNDHNLITALSNDYGYEFWVKKAIEYYVTSKDRIIFISVSGNSKNLVNGLSYAKEVGIETSSLTGSHPNNKLRAYADTSLWVDSNAYNIVESVHTILITLIIDLFIGKSEYTVS